MSLWRWLFPEATHGADVEKRLRHALPMSIAKVESGDVVCIAGRVEPIGALVRAPLSRRECVYWVVTITEVLQSLVTFELGTLEDGAPFLVVDGAAHARVIPDQARIAGPMTSWLRCTSPDVVYGPWPPHANRAMTNAERDLFRSLKAKTLPTSRVRFTEYIVESGAMVRVRGACEREPDEQLADQGYRDLATRPVLSSAKRRPLLLSSTG